MKTRIHDYQLGVIKTYRNNPTVTKHEDYMLLSDTNGPIMQLCYTSGAEKICTKRDYLDRVKGSEERLETVYDLGKVFTRSTYKNAKKFQDKVGRWLKYVQKRSIIFCMFDTGANPLGEGIKEAVQQLYKEWCELKNLDKDMIIRYQNCIDAAFDTNDHTIRGLGMFDLETKKLLGFRVAYFGEDNWAYDLCNVVTRNDYKYLSEVFQVNSLLFLQEELDVEFYNLGLSDGSLRIHKKLLPSFDISYFVIR